MFHGRFSSQSGQAGQISIEIYKNDLNDLASLISQWSQTS